MKKKRIQAFYQERALDWYSSPYFYGKDPLSKLYNLRETSLVRKLVEVHQDDLVLDIGCGPGRWVIEYVAHGAKVIALDISAKTVKSSKLKTTKILGKSAGVSYVVGDAEHLPFSDRKFDVVNCFDAFPHFPNPLKSLLEMRRVLKPSASLIFEPSNIFSLIGIGLHFIRFLNKQLRMKGAYITWTEWSRYDTIWTVKKWIRLTKLKLDQVVGVGYLIPPSHKFVYPFQKFEKGLENISFLNMFGSRLVFKCRK